MQEKLNIDLSHEIKKLEILSKRLVTSKFMGMYKARLRGKGLEFSNFREYTPMDDASLIDWKVSARLNKPIIKEFVQERNLEVFILIDVSSSMVFGSTKKLKNEYAAELIATLSYAILNVGDSLGYAFFSDKIFNVMKPKPGKRLFYKLSRSIVDPYIYGGDFDLENALKNITQSLNKNSILIIVSDFIGLKGDWQKYLGRAAFKFDTIGIMIRDPRDREIPADSSMILIEDPFTNKKIVLDPTHEIRERYSQYVKKQEDRIEKIFSDSRASFVKLTTDKSFIVPIINFFRKREKWK